MVKRYFNKSGLPLVSRDDGGWVKYTDYTAIAERCERLEAALRHCQDIFMRYEINRIDGDEISDNALSKIWAVLGEAP